MLDEEHIVMVLSAPGSNIIPENAVKGDGVDLLYGKPFEIIQRGSPVRIVNLKFEIWYAERVKITFTRPGQPDKVLEVKL